MDGRVLIQFGEESRSEDVAGWVAKHRNPAPGADAPAPAGRRLSVAASGRRRVVMRRPPWSARERWSARDADAIAKAKVPNPGLEGDERRGRGGGE